MDTMTLQINEMDTMTLQIFNSSNQLMSEIRGLINAPKNPRNEGQKLPYPKGSTYLFACSRKRKANGRLPPFKHSNKLTNANCAIDPEEQARRYAKNFMENPRTRTNIIHVYPLTGGHAGKSRNTIYRTLHSKHYQFVKVNPDDWKLINRKDYHASRGGQQVILEI